MNYSGSALYGASLYGGAVTLMTYGSGLYGTFLYGGTVPPDGGVVVTPVPAGTAYPGSVSGGLLTVQVIYKLADRDNTHRKDISGVMTAGEVAVDMSQPSPMTFTGETIRAGELTPYRDWIAPIVRLSWAEGSATFVMEEQVGLFCVMPPNKRYTAAGGTETIEGRDPTWLLQQAKVATPYAVPGGQNVGNAIESLCSQVGARHAIQTTTQTMPRRRTWKAGTSKLDIANDLARAIGFLSLYPDRIGRIRSRRSQRLGNVVPARTISSVAGHVVETVTMEPDLTRLVNHVVVVGNDARDNPVEAERLNDDPSSPTSTVSLGGGRDSPIVYFRLIELTDETTQDAVDQMADRIMDQGSSVFVRTSLTTLPIIDWDLHEVVRLDVATDGGEVVAAGIHRWDTLRMSLGVNMTSQWRLNKLTRWSKVTA